MSHTLFSSRRLPHSLLLGWLAVLFLPGRTAQAQEATQAWTAIYNGPAANDDARAVTTDPQGYVYVTGSSADTPRDIHGNYHSSYATVKYDAGGKQLWAARYSYPGTSGYSGTSGTGGAQGIAVDAQGNVYVTGSATVGSTTSCTTVKYDAGGKQLWAANYTPTPNQSSYGYAVVLDKQGNVNVTCGLSNSSITITYSPGGAQIQVTARPSFSELLDAYGNVYIATGTNIAKYAPSGTQLWTVSTTGQTIALDAAGNVYLLVNSTTLAKYDTNGNHLWTAALNASNLSAYYMVVDAQGSIYLAGSVPAINSFYNGGALAKYDTNGNQQWIDTFQLGYLESIHGLILDADNSVMLVSENYDSSGIVRYNTDGNRLWAVGSAGSIYQVAQDQQGNIIAIGSNTYNGSYGYITAKYNLPLTNDVTAQISLTRSGFRRVQMPYTGTMYSQTVTIHNTGSSTLTGPIDLVLGGLGANATPLYSLGVTSSALPLNSPYLSTGTAISVLKPGDSYTFNLMFTDPTNTAITYTPYVLSRGATP